MISAATGQNSRHAYLAGLSIAVTGAILFSAKAIVAKLIYRYPVDPVTLIAFRMIFSLPFFALVAFWQARKCEPLSNADRWRLVFLGLLGYYLSSFLDFIGLQYVTAGLERLVLFSTPTFVVLISAFFLKKKIGRFEWMALALSYAGIVLVFLHDARSGGSNVVLGSMFILGSAVTYAIYLVLTGELVGRVGPIRLVAYAMCVSCIACIVQFFLVHPPSMLVQPFPVYGLSLVNAVFCTVLPVFLTMLAVARIGASTAAQAGMVGPVSTLFLGAVFLAEPVTAMQLAGTALVLSGIYLLSKKKV
ncbi:MAG: DMT family transporter [Noviherbaspirillum sp.]